MRKAHLKEIKRSNPVNGPNGKRTAAVLSISLRSCISRDESPTRRGLCKDVDREWNDTEPSQYSVIGMGKCLVPTNRIINRVSNNESIRKGCVFIRSKQRGAAFSRPSDRITLRRMIFHHQHHCRTSRPSSSASSLSWTSISFCEADEMKPRDGIKCILKQMLAQSKNRFTYVCLLPPFADASSALLGRWQ